MVIITFLIFNKQFNKCTEYFLIEYVSSKISYNYGTDGSVLDGNTIKDWIYINGEFQITILEGKVREYVDSIADNYSSSLGYTIPVSGGSSGNNHSWSVDRVAETSALIENIKNGQNITKNPAFRSEFICKLL